MDGMNVVGDLFGSSMMKSSIPLPGRARAASRPAGCATAYPPAFGSYFTLVSARQFQQALGGIGPPVQNHILHYIAQLGIDICVDGKLPGVHDSHVHASRDGVNNRNTECIASRTGSLPRNENDTLLTPPLTNAYGSDALI